MFSLKSRVVIDEDTVTIKDAKIEERDVCRLPAN
jgi:hypothetical protein